MNQVIILVEGPTEETFIKEVLKTISPMNLLLLKVLIALFKHFQIQKKLMMELQQPLQNVLRHSNLNTKKSFMAI
jgi:hypothetical protein